MARRSAWRKAKWGGEAAHARRARVLGPDGNDSPRLGGALARLNRQCAPPVSEVLRPGKIPGGGGGKLPCS